MVKICVARWPKAKGIPTRSCALALADLEKWVLAENVNRFRKQLSDPRYEARHRQLEKCLASELSHHL